MENIIKFIRETFDTKEFIPLHEPRFLGNEKKYLNECIDSTFVSSVGKFVDEFEKEFAKFVGSKYAVATVNGTSALHIALLLAGVEKDDEVITQALTFVATANAISYIGAKPIFLDVDLETMGLSPKSLENFLQTNCILENGVCKNKKSGKKVKAIVPMHTFGHPAKIDELVEIAEKWNIKVVEDSAESLGSFYKEKHTGTFGDFGVFSFNGNKIITSGGGGVIVTDNETLAKKAKHLTTTAKIQHKWEYIHDEVGFNYRMPNLNASLLVAQLENLNSYLENKRDLAEKYKKFFQNENLKFIEEPKNSKSNYWLNAILLKDKNERDRFLEMTNQNGVMTRPIWKLMNELEMFKNCQTDDLKNSKYLADRVVNIPSSVRI
jgi:perosamine synthetase